MAHHESAAERTIGTGGKHKESVKQKPQRAHHTTDTPTQSSVMQRPGSSPSAWHMPTCKRTNPAVKTELHRTQRPRSNLGVWVTDWPKQTKLTIKTV
eukprot:CAMPEP_0175955520 /NCGR_PEP_ID=MMETSP0108-20121206/32549_1 /TAXON_ID=195067 ORGANISM="Goniomonas pacifica, Strain CCMP1869" /NCGR_SAMPLE_ID=MMETSP0108 /ASSEMBLY_ACC=CAM_ASM_000204 /LENGTH=96 /DNA_ID=CAMNT_0017282395 /DNA_START=415 /DNA_END=705 /DNA_ORIENTATION=-